MCQGSSHGLTFQGSVWGSIPDSSDTFPSIWALVLHNSSKKCAVTFTTKLHNPVLLQDSTQAFPPLIHPMQMLFSSLPFQKPGHQLLQTTCLQNFSKGTEVSGQIKSQPHALGCTGNIPLENPSLIFQLYRAQQTKSFLRIWRNLLNSLCEISVT